MRLLDRCAQKVVTYVRERVVFSAPGLTFPVAVRLLVLLVVVQNHALAGHPLPVLDLNDAQP